MRILIPALAVAAAVSAWAAGGPPTPPSPEEMATDRAAAFAAADADGNGVLSRDEFAAFHQALRARMEDRMFSHLDADGSGGLTLDEVQAMKPPHGCHGPHGGGVPQ